MTVKHPAKYSKAILQALDTHLSTAARHYPGATVLDPFAGTGLIHQFHSYGLNTVGVEIEPEWASVHPRTIVGDALCLPFRRASVYMVVTSPTYGNRYSDSHTARDGSVRRSYTHDLRAVTGDPSRTLHPNNSGAMPFGPKYKQFHTLAWSEVWRVLEPGGIFLLNVSDFVKNYEVVPVAAWHITTLESIGFTKKWTVAIPTPRMRHGANSKARVEHELLVILRKERTA